MEERSTAIDSPLNGKANGKVWAVISQSCNECGNEIAIRLLTHPPTQAEQTEVTEELGGMSCCGTKVFEISVDGKTETWGRIFI